MTVRNGFDIMADIIRVAKRRGGAKRTWIVYGANLNFKIVKKYLRKLLDRQLLVFDGILYHPTQRAEQYLHYYDGVRDL